MLVHSANEIHREHCPRVLVPTMGALHEGHFELIRRAREMAEQAGGHQVVVSVFVNPTQFNQQSDFDHYPRDLDRDVEDAMRAGADAVYAPPIEEVYPPGVEVPVGELPAVATQPGLEDRFRPGHFAGVVQVVRRLFALVQPTAACFGEKDWQQLAVIRAMVESEQLGIRIEGVPTVREPDGLALSSRNRRLSPEGRAQALAISAALRSVEHCADVTAGQNLMLSMLAEAGLEVEYAVIRDAATLAPTGQEPGRDPLRALIAVWVEGGAGGGGGGEGVRLIDNGPVMVWS